MILLENELRENTLCMLSSISRPLLRSVSAPRSTLNIYQSAYGRLSADRPAASRRMATAAAARPRQQQGPPLPKLLVLTGPTAVGKTAISLELAERLGGEIISADSVQVWRAGASTCRLPVCQLAPHPVHRCAPGPPVTAGARPLPPTPLPRATVSGLSWPGCGIGQAAAGAAARHPAPPAGCAGPPGGVLGRPLLRHGPARSR